MILKTECKSPTCLLTVVLQRQQHSPICFDSVLRCHKRRSTSKLQFKCIIFCDISKNANDFFFIHKDTQSSHQPSFFSFIVQLSLATFYFSIYYPDLSSSLFPSGLQWKKKKKKKQGRKRDSRQKMSSMMQPSLCPDHICLHHTVQHTKHSLFRSTGAPR